MNLPYAKGLIWLYLEGQSDLDVTKQFDEVTLPLPDTETILEYKELAAQLPLSPSTHKRLSLKKHDENDEKLFKKLGYEELYLKTVGKAPEAWAEVYRLLRNPACRVAVDVGILCRYPIEDLAQMVPAVFQEPLTEKGLLLYQKYFFDSTQMSRADWRVYLKICAEIPYLYVRYHAALTKPKKEAMYLAGLPTKPAFTEFLKGVLATAEYKFEYYSRHNNQLSDGQARAWAKVGFDAGVRYEKFSASDVTDFSKSVQTQFEYVETDIATIDSNLLSEVKPPDIDLDEKTKAPALPKESLEPEPY